MGKIGTEKFSNYEYAPGIAVYGIDGVDGNSGKNGTTVFVSQYSISDSTSDQIALFGKAILQNLNMSMNNNTKLSRDYIEGDCFLFSDATIWKIVDINGLKSSAAANQLVNVAVFSQYMEQVGAISITSQNDGFASSVGNGNKLTLDTVNYKGFIINTSNISDIGTVDSPFIIAASDSENDAVIPFLNLKSIFSGVEEAELSIYYDTNNDAYHIESDKPIVIDADVKVASNNSDDFDEYSSVLTRDNSITSFHGICENISYNVSVSEPVTIMTLSASDKVIADSVPDIKTDKFDILEGSEEKDSSEEVEEIEDGLMLTKITLTNTNSYNDSSLENATIHIMCVSDNCVVKDFYHQCTSDSNMNLTKIYEIPVQMVMDSSKTYNWIVSIVGCVEVHIKKSV